MEQQQQTDSNRMGGNGKVIIRRSEEDIMKHLQDQEQSGFSVKDYCEMYDLVEQTFYSWVKKYRSKGEEEVKNPNSGPAGFASIEIVPALVPDRPQLFAEIGNIKLYKEVPAEYLKMLLS